MRYKVGDKVKVREKLVPETNFGGVYFGINMREYKGKEAIVKKVGNIAYHLDIDEEAYWWTDEMLEPVVEMSAEELVKIIGNICEAHNECEKCPLLEAKGEDYCIIGIGKNADKTLKIAKQWKADHEKKPIETENVIYIVVMDEKRNVVYEEKTNETVITATMKEETLKKYCVEHDGKYYAIAERRCVVKE